MFKNTVTTIVLSLALGYVSAQATLGKVKIGKTEEPAIVMVYDFPKEVVANAYKAMFIDRNMRGKSNKGFEVFSSVLINEISKNKLDYSFKLDENGKRGAEKTTLYMIMEGRGNVEDPTVLIANGKLFLENMLPNIKRSNIISQIKKQERVLTDEEDALHALQREQKDIEERLERNRKKQEAQQKVIASQKSVLDDLKSKLD